MKNTLYLFALFAFSFFAITCNKDTPEEIEVDLPQAQFSLAIWSGGLFAGCPISFINNSVNATTYNWDFGDGNISDEQTTQHIYVTAGIYEISLTASNDSGQDVYTQVIEVFSTTYEDKKDRGDVDYYYDLVSPVSPIDVEYYGAVLVGSTQQGSGNYDAYLSQVDGNGQVIWEKTFGGNNLDAIYALTSADYNYVLAGRTYSQGAGGSDIWLIQTDENGNLLWEKTFGGSDDDLALDILRASDKGYMLAGRTSSQGAGNSDAYLIKTNPTGDLEWEKTFGGSDTDRAYAILEISDGYLLAGGTSSQGAGSSDAWLIKTDENGNLLWEKTFGGSAYDMAHSIVSIWNDGYLLAGWTDSQGTGNYDAYLVKTDFDGNLQWEKTFGSSGDDRIYDAIHTSDGYLLTGSKNERSWLIKTDTNGNLEWEKTYGNAPAVSHALMFSPQCGYILAGRHKNGTKDDFYIIKTDIEGNSN